jgi:hypothetical protein
LAARIARLLSDPRAEWVRIGADRESAQDVIRTYVLPLAAIGPIARAVGSLAFGWGAFGITETPTPIAALTTALAGYALSVLGTLFVAFALAGTAPSFGGVKDSRQATKLAAYSATAIYLAGAFQLVPGLVFLGVLGGYSFYLLYVGAPQLLRVPADRAQPFALAMVAAAIVTYVIAFIAIGAVEGAFTPLPTLTHPIPTT